MNSEALLREGAAALDFPLSPEQAERLMLYFAELRKWMRRINLVARETTTEQLLELHFLDSLTLAPLVAGASLVVGHQSFTPLAHSAYSVFVRGRCRYTYQPDGMR